APVERPDFSHAIPLRADALRMTRGNPAHGPVYVLAEALDYHAAHDAAALHTHVGSLASGLIERLTAMGVPVTTPADPARHGANVCLDSGAAAEICAGLQARGIYA